MPTSSLTAIGSRLTWISTSVEIARQPGIVIVAVPEILPAMPCGRISSWPVPPVTRQAARRRRRAKSDTSVNAILTTFVPLAVVICSKENVPAERLAEGAEADRPADLQYAGG